jgi:hypothetical protein
LARLAAGLVGLTALSGCADTAPPQTAPTPTSAVPLPVGAAAAQPQAAPAAAAPAPASPGPAAGQDSAQPRPILGRTTQDIRDAQAEQAKGAQEVQPKVTGQDPITIAGSAYVSILGRTAVLQIKQAVDLYHAEKGRYPKDFPEFKKEIIDANGIRLPQLPAYQGYGYDADKHELVILEYPDKKAALLK